jgi:hypothetical protein
MEHHSEQSLNRLAFSATIHCLTGCAIGEVLGMVIGTALGWGNGETIVLSIALAFLFGYSLTMLPLLRGGVALAAAIPVAFAADTISITIMEIVGPVLLLAVLIYGTLQWSRRKGEPTQVVRTSHTRALSGARAEKREVPVGMAAPKDHWQRFLETSGRPAGSSSRKSRRSLAGLLPLRN